MAWLQWARLDYCQVLFSPDLSDAYVIATMPIGCLSFPSLPECWRHQACTAHLIF